MAFVPGSAAQPVSEVELSLACRNLSCKDVLSKSDPMVVTFVKPFGEDRWIEVHRTEVITNSHDPDFAKKCTMQYKFEEQQQLKFEVYDVDSSSARLEDHDFLGFATCTLGQIITGGKVANRLEMTLKPRVKGSGDHRLGSLIASVEELSSSKDEVHIKLSGHNLDKKDWFGKSDPFLEIFKSTESGAYSLVYRTEVVSKVIKVTLNPSWKEFCLPVRNLCNGDYDRSIKFVCYDWNRSGNHQLIGEFYTTLKDLLDQSTPSNYLLINPDKQAKKRDAYKGSGTVSVDSCVLRPIYSFLDYIRGGTQIFCTVAIDFTGSNGNPMSPDSLHYITSGQLNCYEQAIMSVVTIIEDYDSDKQFPVLGFGAKLPPDGRVGHEFFVNMNPSSPYCSGVQGVLEAYRSCIRQIQLYGPTNFAPVINHVAQFAQTFTDGSSYFILLILTDGVITDMPQTCQAIVRASALPMSIIIVGIGNADFSAMEQLDGDTVALTSGGKRAQRDIVQFVPFSKFVTHGRPGSSMRHLLAKEVLAEIPTQFTSYMKSRGIVPKPPQSHVSTLPPDPEAAYS
ncbi:copine-8-like isoform X2 [Cimex lectularius]|uniref:Copine-3 n=1 Tax=Cimex lectularius TaxID=79782 RepID=A0A8I6S9M3_CIMLE|nr:copine-8-like isoform X2 [Cimex lectularius]